jgi:hypothetical protein
MTLNAVNSFLTTTPGVAVGLLVPTNAERELVDSIVSQIPEISRSRVHIRSFSTHFQDWNPTQHKLDIKLFADQFETIFWLDSDAIVVCFLFLFVCLFVRCFVAHGARKRI